MSEKERPRFQNPRLHQLGPLQPQEAGFDGADIFKAGASIEDEGEKSSIEVRRVGILNVTTGVLVVGDFGYDPFTLSPVGQRVAPGKYPVEISIAFNRVAALRLLLSDNPVMKWHPADMGDGGHGVGVDAGNVSISDVSAVLAVKSRDKERAFEKYAESPAGPNARMLSLVNPDDVTIADSGYGDGRYPVYWGVDSRGSSRCCWWTSGSCRSRAGPTNDTVPGEESGDKAFSPLSSPGTVSELLGLAAVGQSDRVEIAHQLRLVELTQCRDAHFKSARIGFLGLGRRHHAGVHRRHAQPDDAFLGFHHLATQLGNGHQMLVAEIEPLLRAECSGSIRRPR